MSVALRLASGAWQLMQRSPITSAAPGVAAISALTTARQMGSRLEFAIIVACQVSKGPTGLPTPSRIAVAAVWLLWQSWHTPAVANRVLSTWFAGGSASASGPCGTGSVGITVGTAVSVGTGSDSVGGSVGTTVGAGGKPVLHPANATQIAARTQRMAERTTAERAMGTRGGRMTEQGFKDAMATWCSGVAVVTTRTPEGLAYGLTVSSFSSVSLDPPLILVCIHNNNRFPGMVREAGSFAVSLLDRSQEAASNYFALPGRVPTEDLTVIEGFELSTGQPAVRGSLAMLGCELYDAIEAGDHTIVIGHVVETHTADHVEHPLVYYRRAYRTVTP